LEGGTKPFASSCNLVRSTAWRHIRTYHLHTYYVPPKFGREFYYTRGMEPVRGRLMVEGKKYDIVLQGSYH